MVQTEAEWRAKISAEEYRVLRQKGTEAPGSGIYNKCARRTTSAPEPTSTHAHSTSQVLPARKPLHSPSPRYYPKEGHFTCAGCGTPLYSAQSKFDSGCG